MPATVSFRKSIRWIPDQASEPSDTVVLTGGKTGVFLDVRFLKDSNEIEWAFAGYRSTGMYYTHSLHVSFPITGWPIS